MARDRIRYVATDESADPYHRVRYVGGVNADGSLWTLRAEEAIEGIVERLWTFYVVSPAGERAGVVVDAGPDDALYLRTELDGDEPETLLALPRCVPRSASPRAGGPQPHRPPVAA